MKKIFFLIFTCLAGLSAGLSNPNSNQGFVIRGKVFDEHGQPLPWGSVTIENTLMGTSVTADGSYQLTVRKAGQYVLKASLMGYQSETKTIVVSESHQVDFSLQEVSILGEEVVVSATRASAQMPIAQTTLNAEELEQQKTGFDIPYLLQMVPSVVAISEGGTGVGNTTFRIRGTDMNRINVTVNGIPLNDPESQSVFWVNMPDFASSVDNVQVQRGVGTSTQGAGAFGATVNFQTSTLTPEPFASGEVMGGSFNTMKTAFKAGTGLVNNAFSFETRYSKILSDGYLDRGWSNHESIFLTGAWHHTKSMIRFNLIHGTQHTGITWEGTPSEMLSINRQYNPAGYMGKDEYGVEQFYKNESDNYKQNHYHLIFTQEINRNMSLNLTGFLITGDGHYEQYKRNRKLLEYGISPFEVEGETVTKVDLIRRKSLNNNFLGGLLSLNYNRNNLKTFFGGGFNKYNNNHFGNVLWTSVNAGIPNHYEWYRNQGTKTDANAFAKATYALGSGLSFFGDVQLRRVEYALSGADDDLQAIDQSHPWNFFNPKAGVFYQISSQNEVFFSVATAHREPSRTDLKDALKKGTSHTPKPERLIDYELGYNFKSQSIALGINLFYMDYTDQLVLTGKLSESGYALSTNVESSYRAGLEVNWGVIFSSWAKWQANATLSRNRINNYVYYVDLYDENWSFQGQTPYELGSTHILFSPSVVGSSQLTFEPYKNTQLSFISKYVGKQYIDNTTSAERMLDAYFVNDLKLGYTWSVKGTKGVGCQLFVNNIFNTKYLANAWIWRAEFEDGSEYREDGFFPQAGTNLMVRLSVDF